MDQTIGDVGVQSDREIVVTGLIGDYCLRDGDCLVKDSVCDDDLCHCGPGYLPSGPQLCKPETRRSSPRRTTSSTTTTTTPATRPCSRNPCHGGGTCEEHDGTFTCYCEENRTGKYCEKVITRTDIRVASFTGRSFVHLKPMTESATRTNIELYFKTYSKDGIILLSRGSSQGLGDFLSISVINR